MKEYTFTYPKDQDLLFNRVLSRFGDDEYEIVEPKKLTEKVDPRTPVSYTITMKVDEETALTFSFAMKDLKIKQVRTPEEQAEIDRKIAEKTVRVRVNIAETDDK